MKSTTEVYIAIRNIGDSNDAGSVFKGTLRDALGFIITSLADVTMAKRIAIGIGRDEDGARAAIELKRQSGSTLTTDMQSMLSTLMSEESENETDDALVGDDWKGAQ